MTRDEIVRLPNRARFEFALERAAIDEPSGRFRISGLMNSFGVTHSRRLLHPAAFERWLEQRGEQDLVMMAQHGYGGAAAFAAIGRWDRFERTPQGMRWGGWIGASTDLQRETRALLSEGVVRALSVGWVTRQARYVTDKDADLDPHIRAAMTAARVSECYAILDWYPVEGSVVDVGDDAAAALEAARAPTVDAETIQRCVREGLAPLDAALAAMRERRPEVSLSDEQIALLADTLAMTLMSTGCAADEPPAGPYAAGEAAEGCGRGAGRCSPSHHSPPAAGVMLAEYVQRLRALL